MFNDALETAADVDLERYLGRWFEIARLPNPRQSEDCTDVRIDYALDGDGTLRFVRQCMEPGGLCRTHSGTLVADAVRDARLRACLLPDALRWLPFAYQDYWILRLEDDYSMATIGTRNRRRLWLIARARHPDPTLRDDFLAHAERLGYDLTALIHTPQDRARDLPGHHLAQSEPGDPRGRAFQVEAVRVTERERSDPRQG
jgi:apolipoprotein D and lipocalin family protein